MLKLALLAAFYMIVIIECQNEKLLKLDEILQEENGLGNEKTFNVHDKAYKTIYKGNFISRNRPKFIKGDNETVHDKNRKHSDSGDYDDDDYSNDNDELVLYEFFHTNQSDSSNDDAAVFTVITHIDKTNGQVKDKKVRGHVFNNQKDTVVIIEPTLKSYVRKRRAKRGVNDPVSLFRIYQKPLFSLFKGLPTLPSNLNILSRSKRAASGDVYSTLSSLPQPTEAFVEIMSVADYTFYARTQNMFIEQARMSSSQVVATFIEAYFCQIINVANMYYDRSFIKAGISSSRFSIRLVPSSFVILTTRPASSFSTSPDSFIDQRTVMKKKKRQSDKNKLFLDATKTLQRFNDWLVDYKNQYGDAVPQFDAAIAFIGSDIYSERDIRGNANMESMCKAGSNGLLIEDDNLGFFSSQTIAHELAHTLGVEHDSVYRNADCRDDANYVMALSFKKNNQENSFYFSKCSMQHMINAIGVKKTYECLLNRASLDTDAVRYSNYHAGQLRNLTEQCRIFYGNDYYPMFGPTRNGDTYEDQICTHLWCTQNGRKTFSKLPAAERTSCGDGKWCIAGKCMKDTEAPRGQCLIEDHTDFCLDQRKTRSLSFVCRYYGTGRCCQHCNPTAKLVQQAHTLNDWLKFNLVDNVKLIETAVETITTTTTTRKPVCVEKSFCSRYIKRYAQRGTNACIEFDFIRTYCQSSCKLC